MNSIPASQIASAIPSVLSPGGNPLSPNAVFVDNSGDTSIPIGEAQGFPSLETLEDWYGPNSIQAKQGAQYFGGFAGSDELPSMLYMFQYNADAVSAYIRSGALDDITLTELQGFSGVLTISIDGSVAVSADINLSSASSFTNAAALIQTALQTQGGIFSGTATTVVSSLTLDVTAIASGSLKVGDIVTGAGIPSGTTITAIPMGGGTGDYTMSQEATAAASVPVYVSSDATVSFDSLRNAFVITSGTTGAGSSIGYGSGGIATDLLLTAVTGAVLSQGAAPTTPAACMDAVVESTQNWVQFMCVDDPDGGSGAYTVKLEFSAWTSEQSPAGNERFLYVGWDPSVAPANTANLSASFGGQVIAEGYNGTIPVTDYQLGVVGAFVCGALASVDTTETQGRITLAFKSSTAGLLADITSASQAVNLQSNGYSYYGTYATANENFTFLYNGAMPGSWVWTDAYFDQVLMNSDFQLAIMVLLTSVKSLPYVNLGYAQIRAALLDVITKYVNFGAIQAGVVLSQSQITQINTAAGNKTAAQTIQQTGWYLQILPASPTTRGNRTSPPITFWYTDGGSIQKVQLASIDVQ